MVPLVPTTATKLAPVPTVDARLTTGGFLYPEPSPSRITDEIVPETETTASAVATIRGW